MPTDVQYLVGPQRYGDGNSRQPTMERTGAARIVQSNGRWAEAARLGKLVTYSTPAAGVTIPIYSNTTQQCVLLNPKGSKKVAYLKGITLGYVSGTMVAGHFCLAVQSAFDNAISGTSTSLVVNNQLDGTPAVNAGALQLLTAVTVTAFTYMRPLRLSQVAQTAAGTNAPWVWGEDLEGSIVLKPGAAIAVAANAAAFVVATVGIEVFEEDYVLAV